MRRGLAGLAVAGSLLFAASCGDSPENGRATANHIAQAIVRVCGAAESNGNVGPRTITPIDLDGADGPTGFLVTCVNGRTEYVRAEK